MSAGGPGAGVYLAVWVRDLAHHYRVALSDGVTIRALMDDEGFQDKTIALEGVDGGVAYVRVRDIAAIEPSTPELRRDEWRTEALLDDEHDALMRELGVYPDHEEDEPWKG